MVTLSGDFGTSIGTGPGVGRSRRGVPQHHRARDFGLASVAFSLAIFLGNGRRLRQVAHRRRLVTSIALPA